MNSGQKINSDYQKNNFIKEFFSSMEGDRTVSNRLLFAAKIRIFIITPIFFLPTLFKVIEIPKSSYNPQVAQNILYLWSLLIIFYVLFNTILIFQNTNNRKTIFLLTYLSIFIELGTNQLIIYGSGTLISWGVLFIAMGIAIYRVFFDYYFAIIAAFYGTILYITFGVLEFLKIIPLTPMLPKVAQHMIYDDTSFMITNLYSVFIGLFFLFFSTNYGMNQSLKLHRYITNQVLIRYLPPSLVTLASKGKLTLDSPPERKTATIMFVDIVDFTKISEELGAETVGKILNRYLSDMTDIAYQYEATIDKFIGDCIMIVFGVPIDLEVKVQVQRCVDLALHLLKAAPLIDKNHPLEIRMGIHTGEVVAGNFGTLNKSDYTVIGPSVNVAARLESNSKPGKILISGETKNYLDENYITEPAGNLNLKGVQNKIAAHFVLKKDDRVTYFNM